MKLRNIYKPVRMEFMDVGLRKIPKTIHEDFQVDLDPDYQRGHVWNESQKRKYMGFILQGGEGLPIVINLPNGWGGESEVIDGKQRITAICEWLTNAVSAELADGSEVWYRDFTDEVDLRLLNNTLRIRFGFVQLDRAGVLDYYLRLNNGGTVHSDEEIEKVRKLLREQKEENE